MASRITLILSFQFLCYLHWGGAAPVEAGLAYCSNRDMSRSLDQSSVEKWPHGLIPYAISQHVRGHMRSTLMSAMQRCENTSCELFVPHTHEPHYVSFELGNECCSSDIGFMAHGRQEVLLNTLCMDSVGETAGTMDDIIHLLTGHSSQQGTRQERQTTEESHSTQERIFSPENERTQDDYDFSRFNHQCTETCGGVVFLHPTANLEEHLLSSPHYPHLYQSHLDCTWKLIAPIGLHVQVDFIDVDIEYDSNCSYDFVSKLNLNIEGEVLRSRKYCGKETPGREDLPVLETHATVIHFHSDDTYSAKGFLLRYWLQDEKVDPCSEDNGGCGQICNNDANDVICSCADGYKLGKDGKSCFDINECTHRRGGCEQKCINTKGSFQCDCRTGYALSSDQISCRACDAHLNASSGTVVSPGYPISYPRGQNCKWTLHRWPNHHLKLTLYSLDIAISKKCKEDYLKFQHGHFPYQRRMCGYYNDIVFFVDKTTKLRFRSQSNSTYNGFKLTYEQIPSSDLSYFDLHYARVEGSYVLYKKRLWLS